MKKIWKYVFLIAGILGAVGLVCIVVSLFMGGGIWHLQANEAMTPILENFSPSFIVNIFGSFFAA
ncbi:MAG: hypothetical protein RSC52_03195 [Oscillospiraceae bacterium]